MAQVGLLWFNDSMNKYAVQMSTAADELGDATEDLVKEVVDHAADNMRTIIDGGGMNQTKKGGPRRLSDKMYNSVGSEVFENSRNRTQGRFGFIKDPPEWTEYQERGTTNQDGSTRIPAMLAFATAYNMAQTEFADLLDDGKWLPPSLKGLY